MRSGDRWRPGSPPPRDRPPTYQIAPARTEPHISTASQSIEIAAPVDAVWAVVGGFDNLPRWLSIVRSSRLEDGGRIRRLVADGGAVIVERLLTFDDMARRYSYRHVEAPDPVTDYVAEMLVERLEDGGSRVIWRSSFTPVGVSEAAAVAQLEDIYRIGLAGLKQLLET